MNPNDAMIPIKSLQFIWKKSIYSKSNDVWALLIKNFKIIFKEEIKKEVDEWVNFEKLVLQQQIISLTQVNLQIQNDFKKLEQYDRRLRLKLVSTIFYQIFIFSPNDSPPKTMKNVFYFICFSNSFLSQDIQFFWNFSLLSQTFQIQKDKWKWNNL